MEGDAEFLLDVIGSRLAGHYGFPFVIFRKFQIKRVRSARDVCSGTGLLDGEFRGRVGRQPLVRDREPAAD